MECIGIVGKISVMVASIGESAVRDELSSGVNNILLDQAFDNTKLDWAWNFVSLLGDITEIIGNTIDAPNFYNQILDYCVYNDIYNVYVELKNGRKHRIDAICTAINN